MTEALETLTAVRELLSDPKRWTQGAMARDAQGNGVGHSSSDAACWCLDGAIRYAERHKPWRPGSPAFAALRERLHYTSVAMFNDSSEHAEVLALLDRAIEGERGAG